MGGPRRLRPPVQLNLFPLEPPAEGEAPAPEFRWRSGSAESLTIGGVSVVEWVRSSEDAWILDLASWIERRVVQALREPEGDDNFPRDLFRPAARGARPPSRVALLAFVMVAILRGVSSLRGLERFARFDLRGMAILGGWCPDHSTLGRFLARLHDEASEAVFERLTVEALRALGKRVCDVSIDGTILPAVGSRYARLHADAVARHHEQATQELARAPEDATARERMPQAQACADTLAALQQTRREHGRDDASILICEREPEAITHKTKEGAFHPAYVASIVATPERFIVGLDIDSRDELVSVEPMLRTAMAISSKVDAALSATTTTAGAEGGETREGERPASSRAAHAIEVARADGAYLKSKVLDLEAKLGIELRIQIGVLAASVLRPQGFDPDDPRAFDKDRFRLVVLPATAWRGARKCMQCPMGALLEHERNWPANKHIPAATSYRAHGVRCRSCPYASRCLQKAKERTVRRYVSDAAREAMRARMLSPHARAEGSVRSKSVEPCFGSMKGPQGLRRFHRRGRRGARLEWCLHALAHNRRTPRIARERRTPRRPNGPSHAEEQPSSSSVGARGSSDAPSPSLRRAGMGVDRSVARFSRRSQRERAANSPGRAFCDSLVPSAYGAAWSRAISVDIATR